MIHPKIKFDSDSLFGDNKSTACDVKVKVANNGLLPL